MSTRVVINPVTRISGYLQIEVEIENNVVIDAKSQGMMFRGFEKMLKGRTPTDAVYFTERVCGICSTAHSLVAARAVENAFGISPPLNESILRDIMHSSEFLQNHLRHFYQFVLPDYVGNIGVEPVYSATHKDYRIPEKESAKLKESYFTSIEYSRNSHRLLAILGGKAPHNHGVFVGGVTSTVDAQKILEAQGLANGILDFINNKMLEDVGIISNYYSDYYDIGATSGNFMSFGLLDSYEDVRYVPRKIILNNGAELDIDKNKIFENIYHSWYSSDQENLKIPNDNWVSNPLKESGYSWIKAPRYDGLTMEVGPLARMYISGLYRKPSSTMNRLVARVLEAKQIAEGIIKLLGRVRLEPPASKRFVIPKRAVGIDLHDTARGTLAHFTSIVDKVIDKYTIITPSAWNLSPADSKGVKGAVEQALIGTYVSDPNNPVEVGRVVRSFDPCVSCGTHVVSDKVSLVNIKVV
jgi:hydrogenase large subunit